MFSFVLSTFQSQITTWFHFMQIWLMMITNYYILFQGVSLQKIPNTTAPNATRTTLAPGKIYISWDILNIYSVTMCMSTVCSKQSLIPVYILDVQNATNLWRERWSQLLATPSIRNASRARGERECVLDFCVGLARVFSSYFCWYAVTSIVSRCKNPFPTGERVTFTGKNCLCQKCIQAEKSVDMRLQQVSSKQKRSSPRIASNQMNFGRNCFPILDEISL